MTNAQDVGDCRQRVGDINLQSANQLRGSTTQAERLTPIRLRCHRKKRCDPTDPEITLSYRMRRAGRSKVSGSPIGIMSAGYHIIRTILLEPRHCNRLRNLHHPTTLVGGVSFEPDETKPVDLMVETSNAGCPSTIEK